MTTWTSGTFAKFWAGHRATRMVMCESRIRSALQHSQEGRHREAREDLEYIRDHFDCSVVYLHQMIGILAGMQDDEKAKAASVERLKEFGPQFESQLDFSPELLANAMVRLMAHFGMLATERQR